MNAESINLSFERFFHILIGILLLKFSQIFILQMLQKETDPAAYLIFLTATSTALLILLRKSRLLFFILAGVLITYVALDYSRSSHFSLLILLYFLYLCSYFFQFSSKDFLSCIRFTLALVYLFGALNKLNTGFLSGYVIYKHSIFREVINKIGFNTSISILLTLVSILVVFFEGFMAFSLLKNRISGMRLSLASAFHLSIVLLMHENSPLILFELLIFNITCIILLTLSFVGDSSPGYIVVWDANCSFCKTTIHLIRRIDFLSVLAFIPNTESRILRELGITHEQSENAMQVYETSTGNLYSGFYGFRRILLVSFPLSILYPFTKIVLIERLGVRIYRKVALNRSCKL